MSYVPLHCHSYFSLLDGLSSPAQIARRVHHLGLAGCALTDHGVLFGAMAFQKAMRAACLHCGYQPNQHAQAGKGPCRVKGVSCPGYARGKLLTFLGNEFYLCRDSARVRNSENRALSHLVVLAKNPQGWKQLVRATSASNAPEHYYHKPRLDLDLLASFAQGEWIVFSGHPGSDLADVCFTQPRQAYNSRNIDEVRALVKPQKQLKKDLIELAERYCHLFGKENFFLEIQLIDRDHLPAAQVVASILRWLAKTLGLPRVATPDAHYPAPEDAVDQRVLLCSRLDTTLERVAQKIAQDEDFTLGGFFRSDRYHIPSIELMTSLHDEEELRGSLLIAERISQYDLTSPPRMPSFVPPEGMNSEQHLRQLCEEGWQKKIVGTVPPAKYPQYRDRLEQELEVLTDGHLLPYLEVVEDYNRYAREQLNAMPGYGRGSGAGSLVLHLLDVTDCDPIEDDLLFERFYSAARNVPAHLSFPEMPFSAGEIPKSEQDQRLEGENLPPFLVEKLLPERASVLSEPEAKSELALLRNREVAAYYRRVFTRFADSGLAADNPVNSHLAWACGLTTSRRAGEPARIVAAKSSLPDIDCDFPIQKRDRVIEYVKRKYGTDKVAQMATFARMQAREALTAVFRARDWGSFEERKQITSFIPDESAISDKLQEMREESGESSILLWSLENLADELRPWCWLDEEGELRGELAPLFAQAIRLEGVKKSQGRHPAGVLISPVPLADYFPMVYDKNSTTLVVGWEMNDVEAAGGVKFDFLGVVALDKSQGALHTIATGEVGGF